MSRVGAADYTATVQIVNGSVEDVTADVTNGLGRGSLAAGWGLLY